MIDDLPLYTAIDTVYPPMRWTSRWSNGDDIPFGHKVPSWVREVIEPIAEFYPRGLLLFSEEGGMEPIPDGLPTQGGITVYGYTRRHALALFREAVTAP